MADIRINSLPTTAVASSSDDFLALDGTTNGTRKLNAYSPTFGGNVTVSGGKVLISYPSSSQARVSFGGAHFDANSSYASYIRGYSSGATTAGLDFYTTYGSSVLALSLSEQGNATLAGNLTVNGNVAMAKTKSVTFSGISVLTADDGIALPNGTKDNVVTFGTYVDGSTNGGYRWRTSTGTNLATLTNVGDFALSGNLTVSGGTITGGTSGMSLASGGTNQNITLTPSGTGFVTAQSSSSTGDVFKVLASGGAGLLLGQNSSAGQGPYIFSTGPLRFGADQTERGRFAASTGNFLIGTTTDSSNGKIQLADHTTSAGGIGFGTDISLFRRNANGALALNATSGNPALYFRDNVTDTASLGTVGGDFYFTVPTAKNIYFSTNNTTALTLFSNQAAAFAGNLTVSGGTITSGSGTLTLKSSANTVVLQSANTTALTLDSSQNASFAGTIATQGGTASTPANAFATGTAGTIRWDASYIYVCTAANTWKRVAIAAW